MFGKTALFTLYRGPFPEVAIDGEIAVAEGRQLVFQSGETLGIYPARSLLKPFQFLAARRAQQQDGPYLSERFAAYMGSLSVTHEQYRALQHWCEEPALAALAVELRLPAAYPMDEEYRALLKAQKHAPTQLFHPCVGKHLSILEACAQCGWSHDYVDTHHPYQRSLLDLLSEICNADLSPSYVADGCLLPTPALALADLARLFANLAAGTSPALAHVRDCMLHYPQWIGGPKRVDTRLMQNNPGALIAKEGADGLLALGILPNAQYPRGLGIIVKVASGYQPHFAALALNPYLELLGLKPAADVPSGQQIQFHHLPFRQAQHSWLDASPTLSAHTAVWPGDTPFSRQVDTALEAGASTTTSSIHTTLHIGSHVDAPSHIRQDGLHIDCIPIHQYIGLCQVIALEKPARSALTPQDVAHIPIRAPRVLFKTSSFASESQFNPQYVALSASLVEYLAARQVTLVGIDTPSVDLFDAADLPVHHACVQNGILILEGLSLDAVQAGFYEICALPLKLEAADGSPVRVGLRALLHQETAATRPARSLCLVAIDEQGKADRVPTLQS